MFRRTDEVDDKVKRENEREREIDKTRERDN